MTRTQENNGLRFDGEEKIDIKEFIGIMKFFDKHLLVGAELERVVPVTQSELANHLNSKTMGYGESHSYERTVSSYKSARAKNKYNVAFVTSDASFETGNEILFGGNNESFQWNYNKLKLIEEKLDNLNAIDFSPKTSTHISVLTAYNVRLNGIIIKNIFNMIRAFSGALYWIGSGDKRTILRGGAKNYANHSLAFSPNLRPANELSSLISKNHQVNLSKQPFIYNQNNQLNGLFVEFRCTDGIRVPSAIASLMQLYRAIVYKAVELSMDGVVQVESLSANWRRNKIVANKLLDKDKLTKQELAFLTLESKNLIHFCMNYLKRGDKSCIAILDKLAEMPVSLRLKSGKKLKTVDKELYEKEKGLNEKEQKLLNIIIKSEIQSDSIVEWKKKTAEKLEVSVRYIEKMLISIMDVTKLSVVFDCEEKTMRVD